MSHTHQSPYCRCCTSHTCPENTSCGVDRRSFMAGVGALGATGLALSAFSATGTWKEPSHVVPERMAIKVQPVLAYHIPQRRDQTSWRPWGGLQTEQDIAEEKQRIGRELKSVAEKADFPIEILPLADAQNAEQAANIAKGDHDVLLMYAASNGTDVLEALTDPNKWTLVFVRHRSGPVYLWYEIAHNRYLRKTVDEYGQPGVDAKDVIVDNPDEILWRLRALTGLKNIRNKSIVAVGGPSGWGRGGQPAPQIAEDQWKLNYVNVSYEDLGPRIKAARENSQLVKYCHSEAEKYMKQPGISMDTGKDFVKNAFVLNEVFKDLMAEAGTDAFTINHCMGTIMPLSETTACLPLTLLNDSGYTAYCESDFVVIPSGLLLHYISNKPVFLNDPTYPHDGVVTLAHCTAPRKMDGENYEPAKILTHFESDYGAAPKVEMKLGQKITVIDPDFGSKRWLGFDAEIIDNPFLDICRSQIDVQINGDCDTLVEETRGFHWMACYGNYLKEIDYALRKNGIDWLNLSAKA